MVKKNTNHYHICKKKESKKFVNLDCDKFVGFDFNPKNNVKYDGILVNKMVIIKPSMIEKVLKKKIKRRLDLYLKLIIKFLENSDDDSGETLREALNDLTRYKSVIQSKYRKYLDEKYLSILFKKIAILDYELNSKLIDLEDEYYEEKENNRKR